MENQNLIPSRLYRDIPFENKAIRKVWHNEEWYFSIVDIIEILTESTKPKTYWSMLKKRESQLFTICDLLKMKAADNKFYKTDAANIEGVFRIIMSVPSPKAEPLKLWLAEQGKRTIEETENPELLTKRQIEYYKAKGYADEWITERLKNIDIRKQLTDEWKKRDVKEGKEYSILTAIIAKGTFGVTPTEHKTIKGLEKPSHNLRDHMTNLELIFTSLGEELTREEAVTKDAQGFDENKVAAIKGGNMAGEARKTIEIQRGKTIVSKENFLPLSKETNELPPENPTDLKE
jgi:DNA-damage-inducible protein D